MRMITVLVAEDEKLIRAGIRRMVEQFFMGVPGATYQILEAGSGRDAYRKCLTGNVDILITDIKMPSMSGVALAKRLLGERRGMHILAVSGYQDYEYVRAMMKMGVHDYLIKPINTRQLFEAMEHFLAHLDEPGIPRAASPHPPMAGSAPPNLALSVEGARKRGAMDSPVCPQRALFDLAAPAEACQIQPKAELGATVNAMFAKVDAAQLKTSIDRLFCAYQFRRTPQTEIQRDIASLQYELMGRSADYIEFISKSRFGRYDLNECVSGAQTLAQIKARVLEALRHLLSLMLQRRESQGDQLMARAKAFMQAHYQSDLQLKQVAEIVHLHPNYFSALFSQRLGMTFREYLRKLRIDAAKKLILDAGLSASQVAGEVGYNDSAHFFRAFKSVTGMTPSAYKRTKARRDDRES